MSAKQTAAMTGIHAGTMKNTDRGDLPGKSAPALCLRTRT